MMLKDKLVDYRDLTMLLINVLEKGELNTLEDNLKKRQEIIEDINKLDYTYEQFRSVSEEINLVLLEQKLNTLMNNKKQEIRVKINNVKKSRNAHNAYNKSFINSSFFLKKQI
ncbi:flagellar protein FliT [Clostridium ganghwense]|uniref:Flagellar protein FliT n=1 Tax=Clostridium ganghwense TaxID=312089 RepID=A0ABT4CMY5_9CLOT|nr:flagellar protein FliT [Clostridium ganghwense]MCY6370417.1 flagellar protein FliT [Clostridium ganghwense]